MGRLRTLLTTVVALIGFLSNGLVKGLAKAVPAWLGACRPLPASGQVRAYLERMAPLTIDIIEPIWEALLVQFGPVEGWADDPQMAAVLAQMEAAPTAAKAMLCDIIEGAADEANVGIDPATVALLADLVLKVLAWLRDRRQKKVDPQPEPTPGPAI
jgi:hypothetical protein